MRHTAILGPVSWKLYTEDVALGILQAIMKKNMRVKRVVWLIMLMVTCNSLSATSVRLVNLSDMVRLADRVFAGRCLRAEEVAQATIPFPVTRYLFEVLQNLKGTEAGEKISFLQARLGPGVAGKTGMPVFREGEEFLLFLHRNSALGLTSPVGLAQGVFEVRQTPEGKVGLMNALGNHNLGYQLAGSEVQGMGVTEVEVQSLRRGLPIPIETLTTLVDRIHRYHIWGGTVSK